MEGAITLKGCMCYDENFLEAITFKSLDEEATEVLRETFLIRNADRPMIMTDIPLLKHMIANASRQLEYKVREYMKLLELEYNPISNYDRNEESNITSNSKTATYGNVHTTQKDNGKQETNTIANGLSYDSDTSSVVNKVSSFDSDKMRDNTSSMNTDERNGQTTDNTSGKTNTETNSTSTSDTNNHGDATGNEKKSTHIWGNIGVTTTQQMITSSIELLDKMNFFESISDDLVVKSKAFYYYFS